ncbi:hypothetical protein HOLleu_28211 [Holothuria leucospilota]|uniref:Uncharacterized protein n=1 Tax=Holothuria leucospilota TaxID=206669 RepID=A0A9Q1H062_HOLLE|nr:hypothetical protein HOLleu_28211 [Holothuria leucospilota]
MCHHWLPIHQRINYKLALLTYKSLHGLTPAYLCELVQWYLPSRNLRSSLQILCTNGKSSRVLYKDRAFENLGPKLFNLLPLNVHSCPSTDIFKSHLKTYLSKWPFNL